LLVKEPPHALQPSESGEGKRRSNSNAAGGGGREAGWAEMDAKFRRDLPDESYVGRLAYRGLVMGACRRVTMLDGVAVSEKERRKAESLLEGILGRRAS
jgi:hypothetical protein